MPAPARTARATCVKMSNEKPSPGCSSEPYRAGSIALRPLPATSAAPGRLDLHEHGPAHHADRAAPTRRPTHRRARTISSRRLTQSGSASTPPLTFSHSTITVPLNALGSAGRRTSTRVRYGAVASGANVQRPSRVIAPFDLVRRRRAGRDVLVLDVPDLLHVRRRRRADEHALAARRSHATCPRSVRPGAVAWSS